MPKLCGLRQSKLTFLVLNVLGVVFSAAELGITIAERVLPGVLPQSLLDEVPGLDSIIVLMFVHGGLLLLLSALGVAVATLNRVQYYFTYAFSAVVMTFIEISVAMVTRFHVHKNIKKWHRYQDLFCDHCGHGAFSVTLIIFPPLIICSITALLHISSLLCAYRVMERLKQKRKVRQLERALLRASGRLQLSPLPYTKPGSTSSILSRSGRGRSPVLVGDEQGCFSGLSRSPSLSGRTGRDPRLHAPRGNSLRVSRGNSLRLPRGNSPKVTRGISPKVTRGNSPKVTRGNSPKVTRGNSPKVSRGISPTVTRGNSLKVTRGNSLKVPSGNYPKVTSGNSPEAIREYSPKVTRGNSPKVIRGNSPKVTRGISPKVTREKSPEVTRENAPRVIRGNSPRAPRGSGKSKNTGNKRIANTGKQMITNAPKNSQDRVKLARLKNTNHKNGVEGSRFDNKNRTKTSQAKPGRRSRSRDKSNTAMLATRGGQGQTVKSISESRSEQKSQNDILLTPDLSVIQPYPRSC